MLPQFKARACASVEDIELGLTYLMTGAVKKLVIADQVAPHVNLVFSSPGKYDSLTLLEALVGYALQIYCDFAGYSDIAIGCARILGFRFPENFQMPFSALSITEFWRRWHITLSRWFRDYLFLPLEIATRGNPSPLLRVSLNIMLMMLLVGLWHGPSWNFVIFGGIHGLALVVHKIWTTWDPLGSAKARPVGQFVWAICARALTVGTVLLAFVFFRCPSLADATNYLKALFSFSHGGTRLVSPYILAAFVAVFLVHLLVDKDRNWVEETVRRPLPVRILGYSCLLLVLVSFAATDGAAFIYFRF
jgi:alginate O-acetyltransferase complex protein AlgI